ncbi:MAG: anti-sigma factor antagonist [Gemmataceae bacterium]|nr:anti-sigma factor antagonist [Gemmataceae bacterium]
MDDPRVWLRHQRNAVVATYHDPGVEEAVSFPTLRQATDTGEKKLILDLTGITYLSSARLGGIVNSCKKLISAGGKIAIVCPERELREVFAVTRLDQVMTLCDSIEMAFSWMEAI